jgi:hypothetical protein
VAVDEFVRFMRATDQDVTVSNNPWNLYIGHPEYGALGYAGFAPVVDLRYVLALLLEYAATLGLIDVALVPPAEARRDYGDLWGTDDLPFLSRYDGLRCLRLTPLGAFCLGATPTYAPAPIEARPVLRVLPNLEIAAIGPEVTPADRLALDAYAVAVSDHVWRLDPAKLVAVVDAGRPMEEIREFLTARSADALPDTVLQLLTDIAARSELVQDRGLARLIECAEPVLAALIANDTRTRKHCLLAGERHLVVPADAETAFRRGLRELGYVLSTGQGASAQPKRATKKARPAKTRSARRSP